MKGIKKIDKFCVVHFGPYGGRSPSFLKTSSKRHDRGGEILASDFFSGYLSDAEIFTNEEDAKKQCAKIDSIFTTYKHILAGRFRVVRLAVDIVDYDPESNDLGEAQFVENREEWPKKD